MFEIQQNKHQIFFDGSLGFKAKKIVAEEKNISNFDSKIKNTKTFDMKILLDCDEKILEFWWKNDKKLYTIYLEENLMSKEENYFPCATFFAGHGNFQKCSFVN